MRVADSTQQECEKHIRLWSQVPHATGIYKEPVGGTLRTTLTNERSQALSSCDAGKSSGLSSNPSAPTHGMCVWASCVHFLTIS